MDSMSSSLRISEGESLPARSNDEVEAPSSAMRKQMEPRSAVWGHFDRIYDENGRRKGAGSLRLRIMKAGRKNLKMVSEKDAISLQEGHSIMQVISLRGSNLIEVMDSKGIKSLALFPAKFRRSFWIKRGNFVIVDGSGRDEALESGNKIACIVSQVLFHDQVRSLEKSPDWPAIFNSKAIDGSKKEQDLPTAVDEELDSDDDDEDDGLPPLEANLNRSRPVEMYLDTDSGLDSESDP